jgi:endonuclease/exonuclease/phosphatase family metal-dependent hydrolase
VEEKSLDTVRVATWNIKHGASAAGYIGRPMRVAEACEQLGADILALQEVDKGVLRSRYADLADIAAEFEAMDHVFEPTMQFRLGSYGNALLVRGEILNEEVLPLGEERRFKRGIGKYVLRYANEPRNAIMARVRVKDREISVAATHLSTGPRLRRQQLAKVVAALGEMPAPRLLLGDLNETTKHIRKTGLNGDMRLIEHDPTFPSPFPKRAIDHIMLQGLEIDSVATVRMAVSDHMALVADVR